MQNLDSKKNILVIGTGGTIAGSGPKGISKDYKAGQVQVNDLMGDIPYINSIANVKSIDMFQVDSCDMTMENLKKLADYINKTASNDDIDGFVITHGTDTLEETAYFLNLTVKTQKPVIITGSIRPSTSISADGPINLYQAISLASNQQAYGQGVLVNFGNGIYGARDVGKKNTFRSEAFNQQDLGCLGYMLYDKVFFYNYSTKKHTIQSIFDISKISKLPKVEIFYFYIGADEKLFETMVKNSDGVVVAGAGSGGVTEKINEKIKSLLSQGYPIVRSSRVGNGLVVFEPEKVKEKGIFSGNLNPQKARILLSLALTATKDIEKIQNIFNSY